MRLPAEQRRRQLLDVACQVFAAGGFHTTAMDDVANAAGVTKPVLYQHFPSKRALFVELLEDVGRQLLDGLEVATSAVETGRTIGQGAVAGILAMNGFTTVLPTCVTADEVREYAAASDLPLSADEKAEVDAKWHDNFGVTDRYEMPLKSSG